MVSVMKHIFADCIERFGTMSQASVLRNSKRNNTTFGHEDMHLRLIAVKINFSELWIDCSRSTGIGLESSVFRGTRGRSGCLVIFYYEK